MGFSVTKKENQEVSTNVVYFLQSKQLADQFESFMGDSIFHKRLDDYRVQAPRGIDGHFLNYLNKKTANTTVTSEKWHWLTGWKRAEELHQNDTAAWNKLKRERAIPSKVVMRVKGNE